MRSDWCCISFTGSGTAPCGPPTNGSAGDPVAGVCQLRRRPLKGDRQGFWSLTVTGNWRLIFRYTEEANKAGDIDLIDYH
ncbi:MAG: type II toxin-antitoxin system RelE/ParE family toxin [Bryobacteraceae bacterium]